MENNKIKNVFEHLIVFGLKDTEGKNGKILNKIIITDYENI